MRTRVMLALLLVTAGAATCAADALDPYRDLARSPLGGPLLAFTRSEIRRALQPAPAADSSHAATPDSAAPDWPGPPVGVYVSLVRGATTRACVGSLTPLGASLAATLRELARRVVAADPRHPPLRRDELEHLRLVIAFAGPPEPVADPMTVSPAREGLLVAAPAGSIAFLPGEARTISWALREARRAGVLVRTSDAGFQRFDVVSLDEPPRP